MQSNLIGRRSFLQCSAAGVYALSCPGSSFAKTDTDSLLRFGVIADVHKDLVYDADERLRVFIDEMTRQKVDFILQLGDFCIPSPANRGFLEIWNSFVGPRYHVLGNHDTDIGQSGRQQRYEREETVEYWGMESRYYSFDVKGIHAVVLDGNDQGPKEEPWNRWVADDQLAWLEKDLDQTDRPTIVFVHQSPERPNKGGLENGAVVRQIMENANQKARRRKVIACFTGHHHRDYMRRIQGILYSQINSASYFWIGKKYEVVRYGPEVDKAYPSAKRTVPYKDSLFAIVTIDLSHSFLAIEGRKSEFVGPSPWEMGATSQELDAPTLVPKISNWKTPV
ncbi:MAG: alkaline phosphatase [Planctomycetes bacterium]|nr:alkaline phosphatase [Planctomycetota bacterium]